MTGQPTDLSVPDPRAAHGAYTPAVAESATIAATRVDGSVPARAFLVVQLPELGSRIVELVDGGEVTFGRSRGAVVSIKDDNVSRMHTAIRRTGDAIQVEDLGSRNGTWVNGQRIEGVCRLAAGDELAIGGIHVVVNATSALRRAAWIVDAAEGERRLAAEVDRAVRYHRPTTIALLQITEDRNDRALDAIAELLRPMDLVAEHVGDDYLVILPELDRTDGAAAVAGFAAAVQRAGAELAVGIVVCPSDATTGEAVIGGLRSNLRKAGTAKARSVVAAPPGGPPAGPVVRDPAMQRVYSLVDKIAASTMTALILGETGVGKELVVEAIHKASSRRGKPLVKLNCAALADTLLESAMFGHERGAFTGADARKRGYFEVASGGTLLLDEVGEMSLALQAKLLRVLEHKRITRVGGTAEVDIDVRVIAATHRDLEAEVRAGRFRSDLLFRIGGFTIAVPPLRDRRSEIVPLAEHFVRLAAASLGRPAPPLAADARDALGAYSWPGNVRELENAIDRALVLCGDQLTAADLPDRVVTLSERVQPIVKTTDIQGHLAELERAAIATALTDNGNNQTRTARALGLSRRALIYKMEKYGFKARPGT
jgi:DNA-binding NtrC family response regulator/pSer/pThr/pTyr-binding forkhead associated (FHA) protein